MSPNKSQKQKNGKLNRSESENSGKWEDEGIYMKGEKAPLSPVTEAADEEDDDDGLMMYDVAEVGVPAVPDGGYGWVIVFASFMCNLIVDGIANSFSIFLPTLSEKLGADKGSVAWANSLLCGIYLLVGPIVSAMTNKFGCRAVCIAGSVVASVGFALSALSPNLGILILTYGVIGGIGFGFIYLPAVVCVGYYFESKRAFATGIAVCGSGVGTIVFAQISDILLDRLDWQSVHLIYAGLILFCAVLGMLMKPLEIQVEPLDEDEEDIEDRIHKTKPLLQRMAEDKRNYMDRGSLAGSAYFMVQLPDGTMERRLKMPLNVDPGVHSSFHLDQLVPGGGGAGGGGPLTPVPTLPTITEAKTISSTDSSGRGGSSAGDSRSEKEVEGPDSLKLPGVDGENNNPLPLPNIPEPIPEIPEERESPETDLPVCTGIPIPKRGPRRNSEGVVSSSASPSSNQGTPTNSFKEKELLMSRTPSKPIPVRAGNVIGSKGAPGSIPRNGSAPQFNYARSIPKNGSVPVFNQMQRKHSFKAVPLGSTQPANRSSKPNLQERRRSSIKNSVLSFVGSKPKMNGTSEDDYNSMWSKQELSDGLIFSSSIKTQSAEPRHIVRPMSRKDIFYSGSIANLPEFQSQRSISSYRQSILNLPRTDTHADALDAEMSPGKLKPSKCPCFGSGAGAFKSTLAEMMDFSLIKNPIFLFIAVSNIFGMLGFYVPIVFIASAAMKNLNVDKTKAALLVSIMGITNTIGRILTGILSDLPQVNSLFMNNMCILLSGVLIAIIPFCTSYMAYIIVVGLFGLIISGYISLTSIILVDLLGLDNLTNAFGLLILFRGGASILGAPFAGAMYEAFQTYDIPFWLAGGFFVVSAFISFLIPCVSRFAPPKPLLQPPVYQVGYLEDIPEGAESHNNSGELDETDEKFDNVESSL